MSIETGKPNAEERPLTELDRIRDIIFGSQMLSYEGQFDHLANQLSLLNRQLDELKAELSQKLGDQQSRTDELESTLSDRIGQTESSLDAQAHQLADDLRSEFSQALDALRDDKASRLDVGDVLVEMGTRLKQQFGVADLLGPLDETASSEPEG
jgi:DNA anti-recombination protein RmuC